METGRRRVETRKGAVDVTLQKGEHKGWEAWSLRRGLMELVLVPQVGGRIMGMLWRGSDLLFTQPEREGKTEEVAEVADVRAKKREMGFPLWGGDKTWLAPQDGWTEGVPFLDLDSGPYGLHVEEEAPEVVVVRMTSQVCRETGVQLTRTVTVPGGSDEWTVTHRLHNASDKTVQWGLWDVTMVRRPGKVYLPRREASSYPCGVKTFVEEGESVQLRESMVAELGRLTLISCYEPRAFKFGVDADEGWMLGILDLGDLGLVGYRKQVPVYEDQPYGHGCIAEVYNSDRYPYFEMEIHGPVIRLEPGEGFELEERQSLFEVTDWPKSEEDVREHLELS